MLRHKAIMHATCLPNDFRGRFLDPTLVLQAGSTRLRSFPSSCGVSEPNLLISFLQARKQSQNELLRSVLPSHLCHQNKPSDFQIVSEPASIAVFEVLCHPSFPPALASSMLLPSAVTGGDIYAGKFARDMRQSQCMSRWRPFVCASDRSRK